MRVRTIEVETKLWIVCKVQQDQGDWVSLFYRSQHAGVKDKLVWEGPISEWLELRLLFNQMHSIVLDQHNNGAFPAHKYVPLDDSP